MLGCDLVRACVGEYVVAPAMQPGTALGPRASENEPTIASRYDSGTAAPASEAAKAVPSAIAIVGASPARLSPDASMLPRLGRPSRSPLPDGTAGSATARCWSAMSCLLAGEGVGLVTDDAQ